jgi:3-hydroxyacyl-CoA dehydrogenase / enoyl-CoA hydratase / 3-hydroxybutyryl-CoA epimerase
MPRHVSLDFAAQGLAILSLNDADRSVNVLSSESLSELHQALQRLSMMKETTGLMVRSAKPKQFIAGANIDEIAAVTNPQEAEEKAAFGQEIIRMMEDLPFPSVAVIDGICVGGGLEFALGCTYRVAGDGPHIKIGLPETKLGIIPGFGGTQRLPKVVGLLPALDMILKGKLVDSKKAFKMGLVDDLTASEILEDVAIQWLIKRPKLKRPSRLSFGDRMIQNFPPLRKVAFKKARKDTIALTKGFYPALIAAIDVIEATYGRLNYGVEAKRVGELATSTVAKSLIRIFQATESIRREKIGEGAKSVQKLGILGAGVMGGGIAQLAASKDKPVRMRDISVDALGKAMQVVFDLNRKEMKKRRITRREATARYGMISPTTELTGFKRADLIIEAVVEKMEIKKKVFHEISGTAKSNAVLATNTSALSVTEIATAATNPDRVIGLHFFNPVHRMPLVEIIKGVHTSDSTVATTHSFALSIGKTPIVVADRPGFLVNRILGLYLNEAALAAEEGIPVPAMEQAMKDFGMPMGPFELMDEVGLDIAEEVGHYLKRSFPHFAEPSGLIAKIRKLDRLGKKNGEGFYIHDKQKVLDEKTIASLITAPTLTEVTYPAIVDRFVLLMVNEAARCLEEGVVANSRDVDVGMIFGTGFAPFRGGLLAYANHRTLQDVEVALNDLATKHGDRFKPVAKIRDLAAAGGQF